MRKTILTFITFGLLIILNTGQSMSKENDEPIYYALRVYTMYVNISIELNGTSILEHKNKGGISTTIMINPWLMSDANQLTIKLKPYTHGEEPDPTADIMLFLHDSSQEHSTPKKIYVDYKISKIIDKEGNLKLPRSDSFQFKPEEKAPTRLWDEAEIIESISSDDKAEMIELINQLEKSLLNKDVEKTIKLQEFKIAEDAAANYKAIEEMQKGARFNYKWLAEQDITGQLLTADSAKFEISSNKKLIHVTRKDGNEAVLLETNDDHIDIEIYMAKINNKWVIAR